jgi:hypothetical protein
MYAYAYQAPQMGGYPGNQGAFFAQSVPTADGTQNTAFALHSSHTPKGKGKKGQCTLPHCFVPFFSLKYL